jgi:branched-chain amino acid transport system ATP-binding protein
MSLLRLSNIKKSFGGLKAVDCLDLEVEEGKITGLIGPNGAGKTTVFNLITGFIQPDGGEIVFSGSSIVNLKAHAICRRGISRTFQITKVFGDLSVLENVMVGLLHFEKEIAEAKSEASEILESLGLGQLKNMKGESLTISARKRLDLARALATRPKLLLLDEPMGGMNPSEVNTMIEQLQKIRDRGVSLLIIEHVMKAIMTISDRITVINQGAKIAEGTPKEVSGNEAVISAYLGRE